LYEKIAERTSQAAFSNTPTSSGHVDLILHTTLIAQLIWNRVEGHGDHVMQRRRRGNFFVLLGHITEKERKTRPIIESHEPESTIPPITAPFLPLVCHIVADELNENNQTRVCTCKKGGFG
jgi:hypothetical protein